MASLISFILIIFISILITRVAAVALTMTGLSKEVASFQARSAFTGVGFTTSEAESVVKHPFRRKIVMILMLLGNAGVVSAISSLVLTYTRDNKQWYSDLVSSGAIVVAILLFWVLFRSGYIKRGLDRIISYYLHKYTELKIIDYDSFLNRELNYDIEEIDVQQDSWLHGKKLRDAELKAEGILVLGIERPDGVYVGVPDGEEVIHEGDTLRLYGRIEAIDKLKDRTLNEGDRQHEEAVKEEERSKSTKN